MVRTRFYREKSSQSSWLAASTVDADWVSQIIKFTSPLFRVFFCTYLTLVCDVLCFRSSAGRDVFHKVHDSFHSCEILKLNWVWWCGVMEAAIISHPSSYIFPCNISEYCVLCAHPALDWWPSPSVIMHCTVYLFDVSVKQDNIVHSSAVIRVPETPVAEL